MATWTENSNPASTAGEQHFERTKRYGKGKYGVGKYGQGHLTGAARNFSEVTPTTTTFSEVTTGG